MVSRSQFWRGLALLLCALFLAAIARFYHPRFGFTELIAFADGKPEHPALQRIPHETFPSGTTYDGQFYAQLALDPLLRDPAIDAALDDPPYRARRILFSWTAWLAGLGQPAWILQAYALQNVVCWLLLAYLLTRWIPPRTGRQFALWTACMFSHGLLWSVRFSLLDGPSLLLLAAGAALAERRRTWPLAATLGAAGLGRETNLLGASMLPLPRGRRDWVRALLALALICVPLLVWQDYLWSIYRSTSLAGANQLAMPLAGYLESLQTSLALVMSDGIGSPARRSLLVVVSVTVQLVFLLWTRDYRNPWWRLALAYGALMIIVHPVVWRGFPGAITRIVLPMTVGFNVVLTARPRGFWIWYALGNLHLLPAREVLPYFARLL